LVSRHCGRGGASGAADWPRLITLSDIDIVVNEPGILARLGSKTGRCEVKFYLGSGFSPPAEVITMASQAERLGFGGVAIPDHVFYPVEPSTPYPYTASGKPSFAIDSPFPDPCVMMGALGTVTTQLRIRTNVFILPLRHPVTVAKALATAAVVTGGRVELGVGVGHLKDEFDVLGFDFRTRGRRTDEAIAAIRALLRPGPVSFRGEFFDLPPMYVHPAPDQPVPILIGGESKAALERAARLGDGYLSVPHTLDELEGLVTEVAKLRQELAPELPPLQFHLDCNNAQTLGDYRRLADMGADAVRVDYRHLPDASLERRLELMEEFAESIIGRL
jgi:probable F420-dependent oxidoreductase